MKDTTYLDGFIGELLHINEVGDNKLIDLGANGGAGTYVLNHTCIDLSAYALSTVAERIGKTATTVLLNSAKSDGEQRVNRHTNTFEWKAYSGETDTSLLHAFIENARKELVLRGNNPLFFSVGALKWRVSVRERGKDVLKDVTSPLIIFPVKLIVSANSSPVAVEFIDDEIYVNPCLLAKIEQVFGGDVADGMPKIGGRENSAPVDLSLLGDGTVYFKEVEKYVSECNRTDGADETKFEFDKDFLAIAQYKHDELCTYYDIRRNREKIYSHPLVARLFEKSSPEKRGEEIQPKLPAFVLPRDSVQENIITRIVNGESLIVKGPPGTGKTVTIANAIAALLAENKRVLFASKKISALTEVYAKLPERLRKFVMLLDSETEKSASKINPDSIKTDFKKLLTDVKEYREPAQLSADLNHTVAERAKAMKWLSGYITLMFNENCIAGGSFYSALDTLCKKDTPVVDFAKGKPVAGVTREQYVFALSQAEKAQGCFETMTDSRQFPIYKCPWFGIDLACDTEGALKFGESVSVKAIKGYEAICGGLNALGIDAGLFTLAQIADICICAIDEASIRSLYSGGFETEELERALRDYVSIGYGDWDWIENTDEAETERRLLKLESCEDIFDLTPAEIELIAENSDVLKIGGQYLNAESVKGLNSFFEEIKAKKEEAARDVLSAGEVFREELTEAELALIKDGCEALSGYTVSAEKPKVFDFKAKGAYKKLCSLSYLKSPSFKDINGAIGKYRAAFLIFSDIETIKESVNKILHRNLTKSQAECVKLVAKKCVSGSLKVETLINRLAKNCEPISNCGHSLKGGKDLSVKEIKVAYEKKLKLFVLRKQLELFNKVVNLYGEKGEGEEEKTARALLAAVNFVNACKVLGGDEEKTVKAVAFLRANADVKDILCGVVSDFAEFGNRYFKNYYSINGGDVSFEDCKIFARQIGDREIIAAAAKYTSIKNNPSNALDVSEFLYYFEKGGALPEGATFADAFEHSYFSLAVEERNKGLGILRNGLGTAAESNLTTLSKADEKLCELNAEVIEGKCISRIKPADGDYIFVQDRNPNENLRLAFKRHARAICKLSKCMILSPYTASLLFSDEEFEKFDVLIVDEASQLEPALVLPVLFRCNQCVIVGDEWQMPPIKHFTPLSPVQEAEDEGYASLEPEISVLGLALRNEGFAVEELICHYRSKTESLIKYSQEKFYPNMRTFPAPVPFKPHKKGDLGLGLKDVYVEDGVVSAGKNLKEAEKVVEELNLHFDNYYDEKTHTLAMSVGVVAFGEAQCSLIESKVKEDAALSAKIRDVKEHFDDLPEKMIFFKTIETVQGQETGHLILSLTHGRRESGLYMHFGQLNQGKLGRCIFNVAITRAQYAVTVVHSVKAAEVTGSVDYIGEYLATVERFTGEGREQFLCEREQDGFIEQVAGFIKSKGVAPERIAINYGVTEGSVKIPVAVLSKDLRRAVLGVWCEKPAGGKYDFIDLNMRYKKSLISCGWKIHSVSIHDWVGNYKSERDALEKALVTILKEEEKK